MEAGRKLRRGRHQLDIVAALQRELQHGACQGLPIHRFPQPVAADPVILAEGAHQVAGGEEEGASARSPGDGRLLAEVGQGPRKDGIGAETAKPRFPLESVDPALPGAKGAASHQLPQHGNAGPEDFSFRGSCFSSQGSTVPRSCGSFRYPPGRCTPPRGGRRSRRLCASSGCGLPGRR